MRKPEGFTKFGKFSVMGRDVLGELRVAGSETLLYLRDDDFFNVLSVPDGCITGILHDLTKVTLIQCVTMLGLGTGTRDGEHYHFSKLFPHFVLEGSRHLGANEDTIEEISFVFEDATALFYDFDAFGTVIDAVPHIEGIVSANKLDRPIKIGPEPQIAYFTGKRNITEVDTVLGKVSVKHNPHWSFGGPRGVRIDNTISVSIETELPIAFSEAITRTLMLLRFFELVIGRPQNIYELYMHVGSGERREPLEVHWSHCPSRVEGSKDDRDTPQPADLLLDPIRRSEEFVSVMSAWLEKDKERHDARQRFHTSFTRQRSYSVERLIGAANMFDILPDSATPKDVQPPEDLLQAAQSCRKIFKELSESIERSSVLNALGRVGKASLKHKVRHRAQYVIDTVGVNFPDLVMVLEEAVNCRNHYVHGSPSKVDYSHNSNMLPFFTDTLEFVFAASELIEAGWDIKTFIGTPTSMSHPFGSYKINYKVYLQALITLLPSGKQPK